MRSSVSVILSAPAPDTNMSHPDYEQTSHDHCSILVLIKHIGKFVHCTTIQKELITIKLITIIF